MTMSERTSQNASPFWKNIFPSNENAKKDSTPESDVSAVERYFQGMYDTVCYFVATFIGKEKSAQTLSPPVT